MAMEETPKTRQGLRFNKEIGSLLAKKDELNKENTEIRNKFKEVTKINK